MSDRMIALFCWIATLITGALALWFFVEWLMPSGDPLRSWLAPLIGFSWVILWFILLDRNWIHRDWDDDEF